MNYGWIFRVLPASGFGPCSSYASGLKKWSAGCNLVVFLVFNRSSEVPVRSRWKKIPYTILQPGGRYSPGKQYGGLVFGNNYVAACQFPSTSRIPCLDLILDILGKIPLVPVL